MATTLIIHDETSSGQKTNTFSLNWLTERMTVRELIRARIYQEVQDYNLKEPEGTIPAGRGGFRAKRLFCFGGRSSGRNH